MDYPAIYPPLIYTRTGWFDGAGDPVDWGSARTDLQLRSITPQTEGAGGWRAELSGWYGFGKLASATSNSNHSPVELAAGTWVRVDLWDYDLEMYRLAFHGIATGESRQLYGDDAAVPSGLQVFEIAGLKDVLRRRHLSRSRWWSPTDEDVTDIQWMPPSNDVDGRGVTLGNRSEATEVVGEETVDLLFANPDVASKYPDPDDAPKSYLFGGTGTWSNRQFVEYLLVQVLDSLTGPPWTLGGQAEILENLFEPQTWGITETVADMIDRLISRDNGLDWKIDTVIDEGDGHYVGLQITVFSLLADDVPFGSVTLTGNTDSLTFTAGATYWNIETHVAESAEEQYGKLRVLGERLVVCCSLWGEAIKPEEVLSATLLPAWSAADEADYCSAGGTYVAQYRASPRFESVFATFTASPFLATYNPQTFPETKTDGTLDLETTAPRQWFARETLSWLPLSTDTIYGETEYGDKTITLYEGADYNGAEQQRPFVYAAYKYGDLTVSGYPTDGAIRVDRGGVSLHVLNNRLGIHLTATPNHRVGPPDAGPTITDPGVYPFCHYDEMVATVAFRTDSRLHLEYDVPGGDATQVKEIEVKDAEVWWLAPHTCVGATEKASLPSELIVTTEGRELRNDSDRLAMVMAGAIARYGNPRARATITAMGAAPAGSLIGKILDAVQDSSGVYAIKAPITSIHIQWPDRGGVPTTSIATGYADLETGPPAVKGTFEYIGQPDTSGGPPK